VKEQQGGRSPRATAAARMVGFCHARPPRRGRSRLLGARCEAEIPVVPRMHETPRGAVAEKQRVAFAHHGA